VRVQDGLETTLIGALGAAAGIAAVAAAQPILGLAAGGLALGAGLLGRRADEPAGSDAAATHQAQADAARLTELNEELTLAKLREQALHQRIELLENAARAAASSAAGLTAGPLGQHEPAGGVDAQHLLTDPETGLFSEAYFEVALEARIAAARRRLRPVALVLLDVVQGRPTGTTVPAEPDLVTSALRRTLREADTACRLGDGRFALVLEDTPENGAIWTVERIRNHLADSGSTHTVWAGVACYPAHAFDKAEILTQAEDALRQARSWAQDRIEVATAD